MPSSDGVARLRDLVTGEVLPVLDESVGAEAGVERDPEAVQFIRAQASLDAVLDVLGSAAYTRSTRCGACSGSRRLRLEPRMPSWTG